MSIWAVLVLSASMVGKAVADNRFAADNELGCSPLTISQRLADSQQYLPDFSYAGYNWGEQAQVINYHQLDLTAFGAVADDGLDDSKAVLAAFAKAQSVEMPVKIRFPPGIINLSQPLYIQRSHLALQGENNPAKAPTVLQFDRSLMQLPADLVKQFKLEQANDERGISPASWRGGFIWAEPVPNGQHGKPEVQALSGLRGQFEVEVKNTDKLRVGDVISLRWCRSGCEQASFIAHLLAQAPLQLGSGFTGNNGLVNQYLTIVELHSDKLRVKEPLAHDILPEWQVMLLASNMLEQIHIRDLGIRFPNIPYAGHHKEQGYNGVYLRRVTQSSVSNVVVDNADNAFFVSDSTTTSLSNIKVSGRQGHYSVALEDTNHILVADFELLAPMWHNPSVGWGTELNVYRQGRIKHGKLEQHKGLNQQNLFERLDVQADNRRHAFSLGGNRHFAPTAAAFNTFWDIQLSTDAGQFPQIKDAPSARLISVSERPTTYGPNAFIDDCSERYRPSSLYNWQLQQRLMSPP